MYSSLFTSLLLLNSASFPKKMHAREQSLVASLAIARSLGKMPFWAAAIQLLTNQELGSYSVSTLQARGGVW